MSRTDNDPAHLEAEIARQRDELARTVDALSEKLDVKARAEATATDLKAHAQEKAADVRDAATTDTGRPRPGVVLIGSGIAVGLVALLWWRRRS